MCLAGHGSTTEPYELTITEDEMQRFKDAVGAVLLGDEPDYRTLREIHIRLRRVTRKPTPKVSEE